VLFPAPLHSALEALGFGSEDSVMRTAAPLALRGNSVAVAAPPSPSYGVPVLAAALTHGSEQEQPAPLVAVVPEIALSAWTRAAALAARISEKRAAVGATTARARHHLASGRADALVVTPAVASDLLRLSAFPSRVSALMLAWPELELSDEVFVPLFADLAKETPRIIVTADPAGRSSLLDRYAWRAPVVGPLGESTTAAPVAHLRTAAVSWDARIGALADLADLFNLDELTVWTVDRSAHTEITERLAGHGTHVKLIAGDPPSPDFVIFFDPPPPELLGQVDGARAVVLAPPGTEPYLSRWIERPQPIVLPGGLDQAEEAVAADRRAIRAKLESGIDRGAYLALAPLFERWSGPALAAGLYSLWTEARREAASAPSPRVESPSREPAGFKVWVNAGRRDGIAPADLVGLLVRELGVPRESVGRIDVRETFALIEFPTEAIAASAIQRLAGRTLKQRRIAARLDRPRERPAPPRSP